MPKKSRNSSALQKPPMNPLEQMHQELLQELRASGRTVVETGPSDTTVSEVTFP